MDISTDELIQSLESESFHERWFAAEILGTKRNLKPQQLERISNLMLKSDVGEVLCWGLGEMKSERFLDEIGILLEYPDTYYKWRAASALKNIANTHAIRILESHLRQSKSSETRWRCADALGKIGSIDSFTVLWDSSQDKDRYVRWKSIFSISLLNGNLEARVAEKMSDPAISEFMLWRCLWVLGQIGDKRTLEIFDDFKKIQNHSSKYIRYQFELARIAIKKRVDI